MGRLLLTWSDTSSSLKFCQCHVELGHIEHSVATLDLIWFESMKMIDHCQVILYTRIAFTGACTISVDKQ